MIGRKVSEETRQKHRDYKHSEEIKGRMRGNKHGLGYRHSEEALQKIRGNKNAAGLRSTDARRNIALSQKKRRYKEYLQKIKGLAQELE